jgi:hypothetical protein
MSDLHEFSQRWNVDSHSKSQASPMQAGTACSTVVVQVSQSGPQAVASVFGLQVVPHLWAVLAQVITHFNGVPVQFTVPSVPGSGQAVHEPPQCSRLVLVGETQTGAAPSAAQLMRGSSHLAVHALFSQTMCVSVGVVWVEQSLQLGPQCLVSWATQSVPHRARSFWQVEYSSPHLLPSQVATAPVAVGHTVQLLPQLPGQVEPLATQRLTLAHQWKPLLQLTAQSPAVQAAVPFKSPGHTLQVLPQLLGSVFEAQLLPHLW